MSSETIFPQLPQQNPTLDGHRGAEGQWIDYSFRLGKYPPFSGFIRLTSNGGNAHVRQKMVVGVPKHILPQILMCTKGTLPPHLIPKAVTVGIA